MQPHPTVTFDHCAQHCGLPRWLSDKEFACNARDTEDVGSISGWGRSLGGGNGNPIQYSCQENPKEQKPLGQQSMGSQRVRHDWAQPSRSLLWVAQWGVSTSLLLALFTQVNMFQVCMCTRVWIFDSMDCSVPGSFDQGIFQASTLKWVAVPDSRGSLQPSNEPVSLASPDLAGGLYHSATWEGNTGKLFLEDLISILVKECSICYKMIAIKYDRKHTHKQNKLYFQFPKSSIDEHKVYYVFQIQESQKHSI